MYLCYRNLPGMILQNETKFNNCHLRSVASVTLGQFMMVSSKFCTKNTQVYFWNYCYCNFVYNSLDIPSADHFKNIIFVSLAYLFLNYILLKSNRYDIVLHFIYVYILASGYVRLYE